MSALSPQPAPPARIDPSALRLVLFGMPDAGKSSLLGALAQAAETQTRALRGNLADLSHGLAELRARVYEDRQRETQEEIVPYPVRFSPYGQPSRAAVLYDCDGRAANDLLTQKRSIERENREGTLAGAVLSADGLILTVDASAPHSQIEDDFREFLRFLRFLEKHRSKQHAVGGFSVYLVLTKCDLLAREGNISRTMWEARIEERKREVMDRFKQFLTGAGVRNGEFRFGSIDLEVRSTAVRRPALTDVPPNPREPMGVAELFQTAFEEANNFRARQARSRKRLLVTVGGAGGFLAALAAAGALLLINPERPVRYSLEDRVEAVRATEGPTAATRLGSNLDHRVKEWAEIHSHPEFPELSGDAQSVVRSRLEEGRAYQTFRDSLHTITRPAETHSLSELDLVEGRLQKHVPPTPYADQWMTTEAVQQREQLLKEVMVVRATVSKLTQFYFTLENRATRLPRATTLSAEWLQEAGELVTGEQSIPLPKTEPNLAAAMEFEDVKIAAADWQRSRDRLRMLFELATALGMTGESDERKTPLAFPPPSPTADIPALGAQRMQNLKAGYPDHAKWSLGKDLTGIRGEIEKRLLRSIDQAIADGRKVILDGLQSVTAGNNQMPADWARVGENLSLPSLKDWRDLNAFLVRLVDPAAEDPVAATAGFLRRTSFDLEAKSIKVSIPDTLSDAPVRPSADLVLVHRKRDSNEPLRINYKLTGDPEREKQSVVYTFVASGNAKLTYRPGETFFTELPVRKGTQDLKLTWAGSRTLAYQFERLVREPRLHTPDQSSIDGLLAVGVAASVAEGSFPSVPAMVPVVGAKK